MSGWHGGRQSEDGGSTRILPKATQAIPPTRRVATTTARAGNAPVVDLPDVRISRDLALFRWGRQMPPTSVANT